MAHKHDIQLTADEHSAIALAEGAAHAYPAPEKLARAERRPRKQRIQQPLETLNVPGARLRIGTVEVVVGLKRSAIYSRIQDNKFPAPVKLGARCSRWTSDSIRAWLATQ